MQLSFSNTYIQTDFQEIEVLGINLLKCDLVMGRLRVIPVFSFLAKSVVISTGSIDVFSELPDNKLD